MHRRSRPVLAPFIVLRGRLAASLLAVAALAGAPGAAAAPEPRWSEIPAICRRLLAEGWTGADPLGGSGGAEAQVGGSARIQLCRVIRAVPPGGTPPSGLEVFLQHRGGHNVGITAKIWREGDRVATFGAAADLAARLGRDLGVTLPTDALAAIRSADAYEDTHAGAAITVSTSTRASELTAQPDLRPETVPLLTVSFSLAPPE